MQWHYVTKSLSTQVDSISFTLSRRMILSTERSYIVDFALILTRRTSPCRSGSVSTMRPSGQQFLGVLMSTKRMISPTAKLLTTVFHFCLFCSRGKYSEIHRFQKTSERYCIWRHLIRGVYCWSENDSDVLSWRIWQSGQDGDVLIWRFVAQNDEIS